MHSSAVLTCFNLASYICSFRQGSLRAEAHCASVHTQVQGACCNGLSSACPQLRQGRMVSHAAPPARWAARKPPCCSLRVVGTRRVSML